jgi:hypothetical protein
VTTVPTAEELIRAARTMDAAGVPADAGEQAVLAVVLVLRWAVEECSCGIPNGRHTDPLWVTVHHRDDPTPTGTGLGRGERRA